MTSRFRGRLSRSGDVVGCHGRGPRECQPLNRKDYPAPEDGAVHFALERAVYVKEGEKDGTGRGPGLGQRGGPSTSHRDRLPLEEMALSTPVARPTSRAAEAWARRGDEPDAAGGPRGEPLRPRGWPPRPWACGGRACEALCPFARRGPRRLRSRAVAGSPHVERHLRQPFLDLDRVTPVSGDLGVFLGLHTAGLQARRRLPGPPAMLSRSEWPFPAKGKRTDFLLPLFAESRLLANSTIPLPSPDAGPRLTHHASRSWGSQPGGSGKEARRLGGRELLSCRPQESDMAGHGRTTPRSRASLLFPFHPGIALLSISL